MYDINRSKKEFNATGIIPSSGKYSIRTFAHHDIAFEFASWLNVDFQFFMKRTHFYYKIN